MRWTHQRRRWLLFLLIITIDAIAIVMFSSISRRPRSTLERDGAIPTSSGEMAEHVKKNLGLNVGVGVP